MFEMYRKKRAVNETPIDFILKYPDKNWDWSQLSDNLNINISFILKNLHKNWCWKKVSLRPDLTKSDIASSKAILSSSKEIPWDWDSISKNKGDFGLTKNKKMKILKDFYIDPIIDIIVSYRIVKYD